VRDLVAPSLRVSVGEETRASLTHTHLIVLDRRRELKISSN
jgi:hypothetical protein